VLAANGFAVVDAPDGSGGLVLTAVPYSKNDVFGAADVAELAAHLASGAAAAPTAGPPRPARVRAMLAMRACRSSIMVGRPLDRGAMARVVRALAALDSPWNCPHGRPTMRHLAVVPE
jgi:DNA mismatch repair protein PMS2